MLSEGFWVVIRQPGQIDLLAGIEVRDRVGEGVAVQRGVVDLQRAGKPGAEGDVAGAGGAIGREPGGARIDRRAAVGVGVAEHECAAAVDAQIAATADQGRVGDGRAGPDRNNGIATYDDGVIKNSAGRQSEVPAAQVERPGQPRELTKAKLQRAGAGQRERAGAADRAGVDDRAGGYVESAASGGDLDIVSEGVAAGRGQRAAVEDQCTGRTADIVVGRDRERVAGIDLRAADIAARTRQRQRTAAGDLQLSARAGAADALFIRDGVGDGQRGDGLQALEERGNGVRRRDDHRALDEDVAIGRAVAGTVGAGAAGLGCIHQGAADDGQRAALLNEDVTAGAEAAATAAGERATAGAESAGAGRAVRTAATAADAAIAAGMRVSAAVAGAAATAGETTVAAAINAAAATAAHAAGAAEADQGARGAAAHRVGAADAAAAATDTAATTAATRATAGMCAVA
ncbi:hypothetical protein ABIA28_001105 [Bradyrhizobium elkanii]